APRTRAGRCGLDPESRPADLCRGGDGCGVGRPAARLLRGLDDARLGPGTLRRPLGQLGRDRGDPQAQARGGAAARLRALRRVRGGLFEVAERLFGVAVRERNGAPLWDPDVGFFDIVGASGEVVGSFYLDAYARPNKRSGAWMDECVGRKRLPSGAARPVAYLVCNFLPPGEGRPALLTHDDVLTLFHEFGHGLHHLLTSVD